MSSAFVKESDYQKLSDVAPSLSALSFYLRQENGGQVIREMRSFFSEPCGLYVYAMSDGLTYALNDEFPGKTGRYLMLAEANEG